MVVPSGAKAAIGENLLSDYDNLGNYNNRLTKKNVSLLLFKSAEAERNF